MVSFPRPSAAREAGQPVVPRHTLRSALVGDAGTNRFHRRHQPGRLNLCIARGPEWAGLERTGQLTTISPVGCGAMNFVIRRARAPDVRVIAGLVSANVASRRLLGKATVTLYEDVQEFWVAERAADGAVVGCGALHVMWEDLAEIRTVAVRPDCQGHGIGHRLVGALLGSARKVGVRRVFVLTFAVRVLRAARLHRDRRDAGLPRGLRRTAPFLRRGRRRVPRPRPGQAEHPRQHPHAPASVTLLPRTRLIAGVVADWKDGEGGARSSPGARDRWRRGTAKGRFPPRFRICGGAVRR